MRVRFTLLAMAVQLPFAPVVQAVPGGQIGTLPTGFYRCEMQGADTSLAPVHVPDNDFRVRLSSSYSVDGRRGSYLLTGDRMVITGGPFEGQEFLRISESSLRKLNSELQPGNIICSLGSAGKVEATG